MSDAADDSDDKIAAMTERGLAQARRRMATRELMPIVQELDGTRFGVCHHCESPVRPGHLFCPADVVEPGQSCSVLWEHERKRREDMGL